MSQADKDLMQLVKERKVTHFEARIYSSFFDDEDFLTMAKEVSEELFRDVDHPEEVIKEVFKKMASEFIRALKDKKVLDKYGNLIK